MDNTKLITAFQTYLLTEKRVSENTFLAYQADVKQVVEFLEKEKVTLATATKDHLKKFLKFLTRKGLKARSRSRKISVIKLMYGYFQERFGLDDAAMPLQFPRLEKNLPLYLSPQEIEVLFKVANGQRTPKGIRNKVMLSVLYASGMRISELLQLRIDQINFETGFVHLTGKGSKERSIPLPQNILKLIKFYMQTTMLALLGGAQNTSGLLFFNMMHNKIKPLTRQAYWLILKKLIVLSGIRKPISPHSLRHSLATHLLKNGANLRSLQMLLGHENVSTVQIYTHLENNELRSVYDDKHPRSE